MNDEYKTGPKESIVPKIPVTYMFIYMRMAQRAQELGYALALHGSLIRDCDMIAVPWTDEAVDMGELVSELIELSGGIANYKGRENGAYSTKPHGRKAWIIHLGGGAYIDLSVMPKKEGE